MMQGCRPRESSKHMERLQCTSIEQDCPLYQPAMRGMTVLLVTEGCLRSNLDDIELYGGHFRMLLRSRASQFARYSSCMSLKKKGGTGASRGFSSQQILNEVVTCRCFSQCDRRDYASINLNSTLPEPHGEICQRATRHDVCPREVWTWFS
jgi:hypothetical protein